MSEETTTITITHEQDAERGIIAAVESSIENLDYVYEWEIT